MFVLKSSNLKLTCVSLSKELDDLDLVLPPVVQEEVEALDDGVDPALGERGDVLVEDGLDHVHPLGVVLHQEGHGVGGGFALVVPNLKGRKIQCERLRE